MLIFNYIWFCYFYLAFMTEYIRYSKSLEFKSYLLIFVYIKIEIMDTKMNNYNILL